MNTLQRAQNMNRKSGSFLKESMPFLPSTDSKSSKESNGVSGRYNQEILITPDLARKYFADNIKSNRQLRKGKILQFVKEMKDGKWKRNTAETIKFGTSGNVIDGQHRLAAVIKSDMSIWFECAFNVPDENFDVLDSGTSRNAGDVFNISGIHYAALIPSIISQYNVLVNGVFSSSKRTISSAELLSIYNTNPAYWQEVAKQTSAWYSSFSKILKSSLIGGLYSYFDAIDKEKAFIFFEQLTKPVNTDHNAIMLLRNKLVKDKMSISKITNYGKIGLIIKAWNHYRLNTVCKLLSFDPEKENMPIIK